MIHCRYLLLAATCLVALSASGESAKGVVFHDRNGDGVRSEGETGVRGVAVSNGVDVVTTDSKGRYLLPVDDDCVIFLIKPEGWQPRLSSDNVPLSFYVHKPAGSPASKYPGVAPTGPLPDAIDFPMSRVREPKKFNVLLFGDTQPRNQEEVDYVAHDVAEEVIGFDAAFGVTLGDVVFNNLDMFAPQNRALGHIGIPWYNVHGNHDVNTEPTEDGLSDETWERVFGPSYYAYTVADVHFIALDDIFWKGKGYHGELGADQLAFIENDLKHVSKRKLVVLMMHIPIMEVKDKAKVFELLADRPHTFSISSHWHRHGHFFLDNEDDWKGKEEHHHQVQGASCGCWWGGAKDELGIPHATMSDGVPNGYSIFTFDGNTYTSVYKAARRPADYQMDIHTAEVIAVGSVGEVVVNLFDGSEKSSVEMRVNKGPWEALERDFREAPFFVQDKAMESFRPEALGRKLPDPAKNGHMWVGKTSSDLPFGNHLIEVRTTDMHGQTYCDFRTFRVE